MSDPKYPMIDVIESMESIGDEQPRGTIVFDNDDFSPETDSESLRAALKPMMSTDHKALIEIATKRKNKQRQEIMNEYKQSYGRVSASGDARHFSRDAFLSLLPT